MFYYPRNGGKFLPTNSNIVMLPNYIMPYQVKREITEINIFTAKVKRWIKKGVIIKLETF